MSIRSAGPTVRGSRSRAQRQPPARHTDPADLFVHLYDAVPEAVFLGDEAARLSEDKDVRAETERVTRAVLATGEVDAQMWDLPADSSHDSVAFARLIGLDNVLRHVHPKSVAPPPRSLRRLAARQISTGRFNSDEKDGLLLPRLVGYGAPPHRPHKHESFSVIRIAPQSLDKVEFTSIPNVHLPTLRRDDQLTVACLPFLNSADDIMFATEARFGIVRYQLAPSSSPDLIERIDPAIESLDQSGAVIGLLPEGALSGALLDVWKKRLRATSGRRSNLAIVIVGSGPVTDGKPPPNRAVALTRHGQELWSQDKLCDFTLVSAATKQWGFADIHGQNAFEDITRGEKLVVVETNAGRFAILICEDLQRSDTRHVVPRDFGVTHIFSPVFDAPLDEKRWERFAAERHLQWGGSRVAVSNSRVVGNPHGTDDAILTSIGVVPKSEPGTWDCDVQLGFTRLSTDAPVLRLPAADFQ
jgi:hypothetical protein